MAHGAYTRAGREGGRERNERKCVRGAPPGRAAPQSRKAVLMCIAMHAAAAGACGEGGGGRDVGREEKDVVWCGATQRTCGALWGKGVNPCCGGSYTTGIIYFINAERLRGMDPSRYSGPTQIAARERLDVLLGQAAPFAPNELITSPG